MIPKRKGFVKPLPKKKVTTGGIRTPYYANLPSHCANSFGKIVAMHSKNQHLRHMSKVSHGGVYTSLCLESNQGPLMRPVYYSIGGEDCQATVLCFFEVFLWCKLFTTKGLWKFSRPPNPKPLVLKHLALSLLFVKRLSQLFSEPAQVCV